MSNITSIKCEIKVNRYADRNRLVCVIKYKNFRNLENYQIDLSKCRDASKITILAFKQCNMPSIPQNFPWHQFPNLKSLLIEDSRLMQISREDLRPLKNLKEFICCSNKIKHLPGDLLDDMRKLKLLSFDKNNIEVIDPELTEKFMTLKELYLRENTNINMAHTPTGGETMEEIKKEILEFFQKNNEDYNEDLVTKHDRIRQVSQDLLDDNLDLKNDRKSLLRKFRELDNEDLRVTNARLRARLEVLEEELERAEDQREMLRRDIYGDIDNMSFSEFY